MYVEKFEVANGIEDKEFNEEAIYHCLAPSSKKPVFLIRSYLERKKMYKLLSAGELKPLIASHIENRPYDHDNIRPLPIEWGWIKGLLPTTLKDVAMYTSSTTDEVLAALELNNRPLCYKRSSKDHVLKKDNSKGMVPLYSSSFKDGNYDIIAHGCKIGVAKLTKEVLRYEINGIPHYRVDTNLLTPFFGKDELFKSLRKN